ncbi:hypothetical protein [Paracoccus fistulariae]|uniref:hypothetical protein n=1 Tax=Paracoccus fistulariae TaxID=658446 RepID=UPI00232D0E6F|nr:hypothetical protein [Paracoccus fistulariae]MDB6180791.1 hypothetical protein [Paracoccus fistulariae]
MSIFDTAIFFDLKPQCIHGFPILARNLKMGRGGSHPADRDVPVGPARMHLSRKRAKVSFGQGGGGQLAEESAG